MDPKDWPEERLVEYSRHTKDAYGEVLEAFHGSDHEAQDRSLKQLFKSVHCDLTGELRDPHNAPKSQGPDWGDDELGKVQSELHTLALRRQQLLAKLEENEALMLAAVRQLKGVCKELFAKRPDPNPLKLTISSCGPSRDRCLCECSSGGQCDHDWGGPEERTETSSSATCSKCGISAMAHSMWVSP
jgi:hypothetical protein